MPCKTMIFNVPSQPSFTLDKGPRKTPDPFDAPRIPQPSVFCPDRAYLAEVIILGSRYFFMFFFGPVGDVRVSFVDSMLDVG